MRCMNCGYESAEDFTFCPNCGPSKLEAAPKNPAADKVFACLKDNLFFALCILFTCACVFSYGHIGVPVIVILISLFLWLAYSDAKKGTVSADYLRCLSGTLYANYISFNVVGTVCIIVGVIMVIDKIIRNDISPYEVLEKEIAISCLAVGIVILVVNIFALRKIHRFIKSVYLGVASGNTDFYNPRTVRNRIIVCAVVFGVFTLVFIAAYFYTMTFWVGIGAAITSAVSFLPVMSFGCLVAVQIIAAILINKYFIKER